MCDEDLILRTSFGTSTVAYFCNPRYAEGIGRKDCGLMPASGKNVRLYGKNN
jgi:hypothetical protein